MARLQAPSRLVAQQVGDPIPQTYIGSMGLIYLPKMKSTIHVGKGISPMDPMGNEKIAKQPKLSGVQLVPIGILCSKFR